MDFSSLTTFLRVNGLTPESSPEEITTLLGKANYSEAEIATALAILKAGKPVPPPAFVSTVTASSTEISTSFAMLGIQTSQATVIEKRSIFTGRIGVAQYWYAAIMLFLITAALLLLLAVTVMPLFSIVAGLSIVSLLAHPLGASGMLILFLGIAGIMVLIPFVWASVLLISLQVRRYHDYGLTGWMWFIVPVLGGMIRHFLSATPALASAGSLVVAIATIVVLSWPGSKEANAYGPVTRYASVWASLHNSLEQTGNLKKFLTRSLLRVIGLEVLALIVGAGLYFAILK